MWGYSGKHSRKLRGIIFLSMADWFSVWCAACTHAHMYACPCVAVCLRAKGFVCPPSPHLPASSLFVLLSPFPSPSPFDPEPVRSLAGARSLHFITYTRRGSRSAFSSSLVLLFLCVGLFFPHYQKMKVTQPMQKAEGRLLTETDGAPLPPATVGIRGRRVGMWGCGDDGRAREEGLELLWTRFC